MTQQSLFFLSKLLYRTLVTTALFLLGALIMWHFDGAPKHLSPPVSAVRLADYCHSTRYSRQTSRS